MKKILLSLTLFIFLAVACDLRLSGTPPTAVPTAETTPVRIDLFTPTPEVFISLTTDLLNSTSPDAFSPTISQLDLLIQSMQVSQE